MKNSVFGKIKENVQKHRIIKPVTIDKKKTKQKKRNDLITIQQNSKLLNCWQLK